MARDSLARRLAAASSPAVQPGLERTRALLHALGHPERGLRVVHVARTNGKGSVCRMLESVLLAGGLRVGLYTSPHLRRLNERFRIGGASAGDRELELAARPLWGALERQSASALGPATYFEALTVLAFLLFRRARVQVAVLETGLGGRLDSTNVVPHPLLTVITNISLEHTRELGRTESAIAFEKAGIIKRGCPLVSGARGRAAAVIARRFREVQGRSRAGLIALEPGRDWRVLAFEDLPHRQVQRVDMLCLGVRRRVEIPLLGRHQHANLACALAAIGQLAPRLGLPDGSVEKGLARARWSGRLQRLSARPRTLLDGAHNPAGARVLADYVRDLKGSLRAPRTAFVVGILKDKDWRRMLAAWAPLADVFFVAAPPDARALDAQEARLWLRRRGVSAVAAAQLPDALEAARRWAGPGGLVVAAGSLYGAGILLKNHRIH